MSTGGLNRAQACRLYKYIIRKDASEYEILMIDDTTSKVQNADNITMIKEITYIVIPFSSDNLEIFRANH
jgi:hypothetical protein